MNGLARILAVLGTLTVCLGTVQASNLDPGLLLPGPAPLKWDNVVGHPRCVCGVPPTQVKRQGLTFFRFQPGEHLTFRAPPGALIRLVAEQGRLAPRDLEIWTSAGSGLYRRLEATLSSDKAHLLAVPGGAEMSLVRVRLPPDAPGCLCVAIFTSRFGPIPLVDDYADQLRLDDGCPVALREKRNQETRIFYTLRPNAPVRATIDGPLRLRLETRYQFPPTESRSRQNYQLRVVDNGGPPQLLEFTSISEPREVVEVDGAPRLVGARACRFLSLGRGKHLLVIDSTASVHLRIDGQRGAYDNPRPNGAALAVFPLNSINSAETVGYRSLWDVPEQAFSSLTVSGLSQRAKLASYVSNPARFFDLETIAARSARDNAFSEGGLRGYLLMRAAAAARPDVTAIGELSREVRRDRTFFRDLLPAWQPFPVEPRLRSFALLRLRDPADALPEVVLGEQMIDDTVSRMPQGHFVRAAGRGEQHGAYRLSKQLGASILRVVVDRTELSRPATLYVRYDRREPIQLEVQADEPLSAVDYLPSSSAAALNGLGWQHQGLDASTLGGPYGRLKEPARCIRAAVAELELPAGIQTVSVWAEASSSETPWVALQYLTTRPHALSETNFLALTERLGDARAWISLLDAEADTRGNSYAERELRNAYAPLSRLLRARRQAFESLVTPADRSPSPRSVPPERREELRRLARQLMDQGEWTAATEAWTELAAGSSGTARADALLARADALARGGEHFLAVSELQGMYLFEQDQQLRRGSLERLCQYYRREEDWLGLERLLATAALRERRPADVAELAEVLLRNDRHEWALLAALAAPPDSRPSALIVRAAFIQRWWRVFDQHLADLPADQGRVWRARKLLHFGRYDQAAAELAGGGRQARELEEHLQTAFEIHQQLAAPEFARRVDAVFEWERWQSRHPGPWRWREDPSLVASCPGCASLFHPNRGVYSQYFESRRGQFATLRVLGPVRLKIEARPLHQANLETSLNGWIDLTAPGKHFVFPITGNDKSPQLKIVGDQQQVPGEAVIAEVELGPGKHEMRFGSSDADVLFRVLARRPETPLPVLPTLTEDTLAAALLGDYGRTTTEPPLPNRSWILSNDQRALTEGSLTERPLVEPSAAGKSTRISEAALAGLSPAVAQRLALRLESGQGRRSDDWTAVAATELETAERLEILARAGVDKHSTQLQDLLGDRPPQGEAQTLQALLLAQGMLDEALSVPCDFDDLAARHKLAMLVRDAEQNPAAGQKRLAELVDFLARHPGRAELDRLGSRLTRFTSWQLFREFETSAGVHGVDVSHWMPEPPALRMRRCLLSGGENADYLLSAKNELIITVSDPRPSQLEVSVDRPRVSFLALWPTEIGWRIDDGLEQRLEFGNQTESKTIRLNLAAGEHRVAMWVENPLTNHFSLLRVKALDKTGEPRSSPLQASVIDRRERFYQLATPKQPIRFQVEAPSVIRIDQWREGATLTRTVAVTEGLQTFEIKPDVDEDVRMVRVFRQIYDADDPPPPTRHLKQETMAPPAPLLAQDLDPLFTQDGAWEFGPQGLRDAYPPGSQEQGTWSYSMGAHQRRALEEFPLAPAPGRFLQMDVAHYRFDPWQERFQQTNLLGRARNAAGPTLGMIHDQWWSVPPLFPASCCLDGEATPLDFHWTAAGYVQWPGQAPAPHDSSPWSAALRGTLSRRNELSPHAYHRPSLTLFGRWLSMDENPFAPGVIDEDVFTIFKSEHRIGLRLSDKFTYQPRLDTQWWVRPALMTNEDFNLARPDNLSIQTGVAYLLGPCELDVAYRAIGYLSDKDRTEGSVQHLLYFQALLERWQCGHQRLELSIGIRHDLSAGETSGQVTLTAFQNAGRAFRDLHPSLVRFRSLQEQRAFRLWGVN